jgi:3-ketosteroid 9alpha-monooxygenase subunit A
MERDIIGCPDHAWRFGSDGRCDNIAHFAGPIPASARVSACSVAERFGGVFAWHDLEEAAPEFDLSQPPQRGRPRWIQSEFDDLGATAIHPQEIAANIADPGRFELSHGQILHDFGNTDVGVIARQRSGATKP